jgi:Kef-type K+ transport system membrane component KefB
MEQILFSVVLQLAFIIATARVFAALFQKLGQPGVCGEMAAGLILGPSLFGKFFPGIFHRIFDPSVSLIFTMFAQVGLVLLLFLLGMEFEFNHLRTHGRKALLISISAMSVPFGLGLVLAKFMYPFVGQGIFETGFSLFTATALSITALPILGIILVEFNLNRTELGVIAITSAALMDVTGWMLLATVNAIVRSNFQVWLTVRMLLEVIAFGAAMFFVVRPLMKKWIHHVMRTEGNRISITTLAILLVLVFASAMTTSKIGIFSIFGGFIMGAILFDEPEFRKQIASRLQDFVRVFFVPIFFMYTGLRTDAGSMGGAVMWTLFGITMLVAVLAKVGPATMAARVGGFSWPDSLSMGVLMNTRALMELIVLNIGYDLGVIPKSVFFTFVLMAVITTLMTAPLLRRTLRYAGFKPPQLEEVRVGQLTAASSGD